MLQTLDTLLQANSFEVFGLQPSFNIDKSCLADRYRHLQKQFHPDNFVTEDQNQHLKALSVSAHINNAYTTLTTPLLLAMELLKVNNINFSLTNNTDLPADFLMEQLVIHEAIEDAEGNKDIDALTEIENNLKQKQKYLVSKIDESFTIKNFAKCIEYTKKLAFYDKLLKLISDKIERLW